MRWRLPERSAYIASAAPFLVYFPNLLISDAGLFFIQVEPSESEKWVYALCLKEVVSSAAFIAFQPNWFVCLLCFLNIVSILCLRLEWQPSRARAFVRWPMDTPDSGNRPISWEASKSSSRPSPTPSYRGRTRETKVRHRTLFISEVTRSVVFVFLHGRHIDLVFRSERQGGWERRCWCDPFLREILHSDAQYKMAGISWSSRAVTTICKLALTVNNVTCCFTFQTPGWRDNYRPRTMKPDIHVQNYWFDQTRKKMASHTW